MNEKDLTTVNIDSINAQDQILKVKLLINLIGVCPKWIYNDNLIEADQIKQFVRG